MSNPILENRGVNPDEDEALREFKVPRSIVQPLLGQPLEQEQPPLLPEQPPVDVTTSPQQYPLTSTNGDKEVQPVPSVSSSVVPLNETDTDFSTLVSPQPVYSAPILPSVPIEMRELPNTTEYEGPTIEDIDRSVIDWKKRQLEIFNKQPNLSVGSAEPGTSEELRPTKHSSQLQPAQPTFMGLTIGSLDPMSIATRAGRKLLHLAGLFTNVPKAAIADINNAARAGFNAFAPQIFKDIVGDEQEILYGGKGMVVRPNIPDVLENGSNLWQAVKGRQYSFADDYDPNKPLGSGIPGVPWYRDPGAIGGFFLDNFTEIDLFNFGDVFRKIAPELTASASRVINRVLTHDIPGTPRLIPSSLFSKAIEETTEGVTKKGLVTVLESPKPGTILPELDGQFNIRTLSEINEEAVNLGKPVANSLDELVNLKKADVDHPTLDGRMVQPTERSNLNVPPIEDFKTLSVGIQKTRSINELIENSVILNPGRWTVLPDVGRRALIDTATSTDLPLPTSREIPLPTTLATDTPPLYHGTRVVVDDLSTINPLLGGARGDVGPAIYLTDEPVLAREYAKASIQSNLPLGEAPRLYDGSGRVLSVTINPNANVLTTSPEIYTVFKQAASEVLGSDSATYKKYNSYFTRVKPDDLGKIYDKFTELTISDGVFDERTVLNFQRKVNAKLFDMGYDAIDYNGDLAVINPKAILNSTVEETVPELPLIDQAVARFNADSVVASRNPRSVTPYVNMYESGVKVKSYMLEEGDRAIRAAEIRQRDLLNEVTKNDSPELYPNKVEPKPVEPLPPSGPCDV